MCQQLWKHHDWLWTFDDVQGIEPTNNTVERRLRPAVIYRKPLFGTHSESGTRFIERMLTAFKTRHLKQRSIFTYLIDAVTAHFEGPIVPAPLPAP